MRTSSLLLICFCLTVLNPAVFSNIYYDNNSNIRLAHKDLYALCLLSAEKLLQKEEQNNPSNGYITFYRLYSDIIALTINNSSEEFNKRLPVLNRHIKTLKELPDDGPYYRLLLGEAYVLTGLINVKYENKFSGLIDCLKGYNLLEDNDKKYPLFEPDDKMLGLIQIGVAYMPKALRWGIKIFNINGNPQAGLEKLYNFSQFARGKPGYEEEALLFTLAAYRLMNHEEAALKLIKDEMVNIREVAVLNLIAATVCVQANDAETALTLLSGITIKNIEIEFPQLLYMQGKTKLMRLDPDSDALLLAYMKESSGTDYLKTVLYDLACYYYINGNTQRYLAYIEQVKEKGREFLARDIEAAFEAKKSDLPNRYLLSADFLVRGGYIVRAEHELSYISKTDTLKDGEKAHYYYLRGECYRLKNLIKQAETAYLNAVKTGKSSGSHFAQEALVNSGFMMENNSLIKEAEKYYNLCLEFKPASNPYSDSHRNKARAGLIRLSLSQ